MLLLIVLHLLLVCVVSHPPSLLVTPSLGCRADELEALLAFKAAFAVGSFPIWPWWNPEHCERPYAKTDSWRKGSSRWDGVTCDPTSGHVTELDLSCSLLSGAFPSNTTLFHLRWLRHLDLAYNNFSGSPIPLGFGQFSRLSYLNLSGSTFSGQVPSEIGWLSRLTTLDLSYSNVEMPNFKTIIANLSDLRELHLSDVGIYSNLPPTIANLSELETLRLPGCGLYGEFPAGTVLNMPKLCVLDLGAGYMNLNRFYGTLPPTMNTTSLDRLSTIDISINMITGMIPTWLFSLPSLNSLQLSVNRFTGMSHSPDSNASASSSSVLSDFSALYNQLQGQIPQVVFELHNLQSLDLEDNNLTGIVQLSKLHNLQNLIYLSLSSNNLSIIDDMGANSTYSWPNLRDLDLSSCNLGHFPGFLRRQEGLRALDLSNCGIQGLVPQWFLLGATSLRHLSLSHNSLTGGLDHLPCKNVGYIDISFNMLQGVVPIPPLNTFVFWASNNQFVGEIPPSICDLGKLDMLDLSHNNLNGSIPICLANLTILDLRTNQLQGVIPSAIFENCRSLTALSLSGNLLHGSIPQSLSNCTQLQLLDVGHNNLNGTFPSWLDVLPNLKVLILGSNKLKGTLLSSNLTNPYPKLQILDISNNDITGGLPGGLLMSFKAMIEPNISGQQPYMSVSIYQDSINAWIKGINRELSGILDTLVFIDASRNRLEGSIPEAIGDLVSLRSLNLAHNNFQGSIPSSLGKLSLLESLDLSFNRLDGRLPSELVNLNYLGFFNVSENDLQGEVPTSKQFGTFLDNSYLGNPRLCGELLTRKCRKKGDPPNSRASEGEPTNSGFHVWVNIVLMGFGCGMFVGSVWGYFIFWERNLYQVEKLIFKMEVVIKQCKWIRFRNIK